MRRAKLRENSSMSTAPIFIGICGAGSFPGSCSGARTSVPHECGGSEVRIFISAGSLCGFLDQSHTELAFFARDGWRSTCAQVMQIAVVPALL
jgi:hypothetical protein